MNIPNPTEDDKKYYLRVYIKRSRLSYSSNEAVRLIINRDQFTQLNSLDLNKYVILYLENVACAVETGRSTMWCNNFIKETTITYIKKTNSKYLIKRKNIDKFINELSKFVNKSNVLVSNEVIPKQIRNNSKNNINCYQILLQYKYLINSRYRYLRFDSINNSLYCNLISGEIITFEDIAELIGYKVKDKSNNIYIIETIELNDGEVYELTLN